MMKKRYWRRTDFILIAATAGIIIMSLVIIGSATHINTPSEERYWFLCSGRASLPGQCGSGGFFS